MERCPRCNIPMISAAVAAGECDLCAEKDRRAGMPRWKRRPPPGVKVDHVAEAVPVEVDPAGPYRAAVPSRGTLILRVLPARRRAWSEGPMNALVGVARLAAIALSLWALGSAPAVELSGELFGGGDDDDDDDAANPWRSGVTLTATPRQIRVERSGKPTTSVDVASLRRIGIVDAGDVPERYRLVALRDDSTTLTLAAAGRLPTIRWLHRTLTEFVGVRA